MALRDPEQEAAEALVLEHLPDIATLCNRMFVQRSDAEDATHEAVLAILRALPSYRREGPVRHWLLKVALNAARSHRRGLSRKTRREAPLVAPEEVRAVSTDRAEEREDREAVRVAIACLPDDLREPLILSHYHGLTQTEIGAVVACSQKTVHVRLKKALDTLRSALTGIAPATALLAPTSVGEALLDSVSPQLIASVRESVATHYAAAAASTATGTSASLATAKTVAATGLAAGGLIMQLKLIAGGAVLAAACLVGGALFSEQVLGGDGSTDADAQMELDALRSGAETDRAELADLRDQVDAARSRDAARIRALQRQVASLEEQLASQSALLAGAADKPTSGTFAEEDAAAAEKSREERWADIRKTIEPVIAIMLKMEEEGANQFQLGPQMVAELGKLDADDFAELVAFDDGETDEEIVGTIQAVMLQAFIFIPATDPLKNDYMARYLERANSGQFGEGAYDRALSRLSFSMPPFVDAYAKLVEPLDDELKARYQSMAYSRIAAGNPEPLQLDGARFLARSSDPRATEELMRAFGEASSSQRLRLTVVAGLSSRRDAETLRFLQEAESREAYEAVRAQLAKAVAKVEAAVAKQGE